MFHSRFARVQSCCRTRSYLAYDNSSGRVEEKHRLISTMASKQWLADIQGEQPAKHDQDDEADLEGSDDDWGFAADRKDGELGDGESSAEDEDVSIAWASSRRHGKGSSASTSNGGKSAGRGTAASRRVYNYYPDCPCKSLHHRHV